MNKLSVFASVRVGIHESVFYCLYWLAKEEIQNVTAKSLLHLVEKLGSDILTGGEGVLLYMGHIGMCHCEGYGF